MTAPRLHLADAYREWHHASVTIEGVPRRVATKQGVFAHRSADPSSVLLAEKVKVADGSVLVHLNGDGLLASVAATTRGASRVIVTHRNVVAAEAAQRTIVANSAERAEVVVGHGSASLPSLPAVGAVAIRIPQERLSTLQLLWDAFELLEVGGRCWIAGATNEGIKTAARTMETLFGNAAVMAQASGHRLVAATKRADTPASDADLGSPYLDHDAFHELHAELRGTPMKLFTRPGVFSWEHVDEATELLAVHMEISASDSVLDLGCGYGPLGTLAGMLSGDGTVTMVDADVEAVRSALKTATEAGLPRVRALPSDVGAAVIEDRFNVVVTNPPFHVGKATDLSVPLQFIHDAWAVLEPKGRMFLVANRTLPYEVEIRARFGNMTTVHDGRRFKVISAERHRGSSDGLG